MPPVPKVDGKSIRYVRHKVFQDMPQHKFAALLSKETGEHISSQRLARLEAYGKQRAVHPEKPTHAVEKFLLQYLDQGSSTKANTQQQGEHNDSDHSTPDQAEQDDEKLYVSGERSMTRQELIKKIIDDYKDMGLREAEGDTALEMIQSVESKIRETEKELVGTTQSELNSLSKDLKALEEEEEDIDTELEKLRAELATLDGDDNVKVVGLEDKDGV